MTAQDLKNSILQRAMQGKLVEQRDDEGTAAELLIKIKAEKDRLIKDGKIKKEKPLPEISEDEIPFDIPDSWEWVRLPEIAASSLGKTLNKSIDKGIAVSYLCSINVYWDGIDLTQLKSAKFNDKDIKKYRLKTGDLLICEGGDVGRSAVWNSDKEMYYQNALHCVRFYGEVDSLYFKYCLELYKYMKILDEASKGMTIKHLVQASLYSLVFPLPPLAEQKRIVAKIEELMPFVEQYGKAYDKLTQLNNKFPEDMRKSILQYAMQGKLVEQRAKEGTAEELLKQIKAEKDRLINEGKINKEKPLPEITDEEKPFDIPNSWEWVRLEFITYPVGNKTNQIQTKEIMEKGKIPVVSQGQQLIDGYCNEASKIISDLPLVMFGDHTRNVKYIDFPFVIGADGTKFHKCICVIPKYIYYWMNYITVNLRDRGYARHYSLLKEQLIPLPPLAEQHRIVEAIENLMPYCRQLSK